MVVTRNNNYSPLSIATCILWGSNDATETGPGSAFASYAYAKTPWPKSFNSEGNDLKQKELAVANFLVGLNSAPVSPFDLSPHASSSPSRDPNIFQGHGWGNDLSMPELASSSMVSSTVSRSPVAASVSSESQLWSVPCRHGYVGDLTAEYL